MKKILTSSFIVLALALVACGGKDDKKDGDAKKEGTEVVKEPEVVKETAASIAQQWCDLNAKLFKAAEGAEKDAAKAAQKAFEDNMEKKYENDKAFMEEIGKEVEKCEDASEGK